jgi:hypothetical protein
VLLCAGAVVYLTLIAPERMTELQDRAGANILPALAAVAVLGAAAIVTCAIHRGLSAVAWVLGILWIVVSFAVSLQINDKRSSRSFVAVLDAVADPGRELGLMGYKEQFLLYLDRPSVNFGHRRWREGGQESYDAARWLNADPARQLLVPESSLAPCFLAAKEKIAVDKASREHWFLVSGPADAGCARRGEDRAIPYGAKKSPRRSAG